MILTMQRRGLSHNMFEILVFLRYNERLWGKEEVFQAMREVRSDGFNDTAEVDRVQEMRELEELYVSLEGLNMMSI